MGNYNLIALPRPLKFIVSTNSDLTDTDHIDYFDGGNNDLDDIFCVGDVDGVNDQVWRVDHISGRWVKSIIAVISSDKVRGDYYSHMMDRVTCL